MHDVEAFHHMIKCLLRSQGIAHERSERRHLAYTIRTADGLFIDLIGLQPGFLNLRSLVATLPADAQRGSLLRLLCANQFAFEHPPVSVGIEPATPAVTVWSRQALAELDADLDCQWYLRFAKIASTIRQWLLSVDHSAGPEELLPSGKSSHRLNQGTGSIPRK